MNVFITAVSAFLPGNPVGNDDLDLYLGEATGQSAKTRRIILARNGIQQRHYAIAPLSGNITYTNAQLAAEAIRQLTPNCLEKLASIECLCCGTSSPDQIMPGHGSMVHGELNCGPCEVISTAGICLTGITALKYGAMSIAAGLHKNAVACGSEAASSFLRSSFFTAMGGKESSAEATLNRPAFSFEAEFLRWMLSDGAGAVYMQPKPNSEALSLRIDWIDIVSHAHRLDTCMYAGAVKQKDGNLKGWRECAVQNGLEQQGIMTIKQDAGLLNQEIISVIVNHSLPPVIQKYSLTPDMVDWFLPHYSSDFFRVPLMQQMEQAGFAIPESRWFTNLPTKGNTGSASFYIMLEELFSSNRLQKGQRILGMIPESGRFSVGWVLMTVV
ncbi:beta-ketoacyl-ACP synthase III [Desulfogranum japonicum]|uniref:beta-ketoacyl-ACP synthase III n=1 Tax=Desulfogranum japonicum TaxID=231447 RepID=UPI00041F3EA2|nr:beta-ketoacyl-ACP synthase III [Desulfogranum japonicum]